MQTPHRQADPAEGGVARRWIAQALTVLAAAALLVLAALATPAWFERHFLPEFFQSRPEQLRWLALVRVTGVVLGLLLLWPIGPRLGRWAAGKPPRDLALDILPTLLAVVLALPVSELLLRHLPWFSTHQLSRQSEPLRRRDPVTGWAYAENRVGRGLLGGRMIEYAFDPAGHRVARGGDRVDYAAPSVLFVGESIITGHGLAYDETIPAQVAARLGLQAADLAVGGFATDQMYLRFQDEWPRFRQPRAVVILFMPSLFHRNLERDRPHLAPDLTWRPASDAPRLVQIAQRLVPYRSGRELSDAETMTRRALAGMVASARARGAVPLILVPDLAPETPEEQVIRARVLAGLPYIRVSIDPTWHIPRNRHPDARADAKLAQEVAGWLEAQGVRGAALRSPGG